MVVPVDVEAEELETQNYWPEAGRQILLIFGRHRKLRSCPSFLNEPICMCPKRAGCSSDDYCTNGQFLRVHLVVV